jgi:hypothetical protein
MTPTTLEPPITLEITVSEALFRQLQQVLDTHPTYSLDDLTQDALSAYLLQFNSAANPFASTFKPYFWQRFQRFF